MESQIAKLKLYTTVCTIVKLYFAFQNAGVFCEVKIGELYSVALCIVMILNVNWEQHEDAWSIKCQCYYDGADFSYNCRGPHSVKLHHL